MPQRGAILEWARLNPGYIPDFILQMYHNLEFQGWFKSYYDTLRLMFKRLIEDNLPFIPDLEDELKTNFELQATVEKSKLEEILVEAEERRERVIWINDGLKHIDVRSRPPLASFTSVL